MSFCKLDVFKSIVNQVKSNLLKTGKFVDATTPQETVGRQHAIVSEVAILDSLASKLQYFNTYFRGSDVDVTLREKLLERGITEDELAVLEKLNSESKYPQTNFSSLISGAYSKYLDNNLLSARLAKLKMQQADDELDKRLIDFAKDLGITTQIVDDIKSRFGVDAYGVADILNKTIYASKDRKLDTVAEEVGHFYTELIGAKEGLGKQLMDNIENWSGYTAVYEKYKSKYTNNGAPNTEKIKKEAIAQAISEAILKQYATKSEKIPQEERTFWETILQLIERFTQLFSSKNAFPLEAHTNEIAKKIFNKDYTDILSRIAKVKLKNTELKEFDSSLAKFPLASDAVKKLMSLGATPTGSLALRAQGTIYRNSDEKLHDIDTSVNWDVWKGDWRSFIEKVKLTIPNYRTLQNNPYTGNSNELVLNGMITADDSLYQRFKETPGDYNTRMDSFTLEEQERMLLVDFFFNGEGNDTKVVKGLQDAGTIFTAKSNMGMREKDVFDLLSYQPFEQPTELSHYSYFQLKEGENGEEEINEQNEAFGEPLVSLDGNKVNINPSDALVDDYWEVNRSDIKIKKDRIEEIYNGIKNIAADNGVKALGDHKGYIDKAGKILKRVSDIVKEHYARIFGKKDDELSAEQKAKASVASERGTQFHADMENMFRPFIDPYTGKKKYSTREEMDAIDISGFVPQMKVTDEFRDEYINILLGYVKDKLDTYSSDARFLFETVIYNKRKNVAGTVDFIAIDGKGIDILDWKTIYNLNEDNKIYPAKRQGFNIQLNEYFKAIKNSVDLKDADFNQIRVIPVLPTKTAENEISALDIGKVNPKDDQIALLPVLSFRDAAYKGSIKKFLDSLKEIQARENIRLSRETGFKREDYKLKEEIDEAIQQIITQQNPDSLFEFLDEILSRVDDYIKQTATFSTDPAEMTREDMFKYSEKLNDAKIGITGVSDFLNFSKENLQDYINASEDNAAKINNYSFKISNHLDNYNKTNKAYFKKVAESNGISAIEKAQLEITTIQKWTTNLHSTPKTKTVQLLSKVLLPVHNQISVDKEDAKLKVIRFSEQLKQWGKKNGKGIEQVYDMFLSKDDKGKFNGRLNTKVDKSFYEARDKAFEGKGRLKFVADNYNLAEYNKEVDDFLAVEFAKIDGMATSNEQKTRDKESFIRRYKDPVTAFTAKNKFLHSIDDNGNYRFIKEEAWYSPFYEEISKPGNEALMEFYKYITSLNRRARATGLSETKSNAVPHILKGMIETGWDFKAQKDRYLASIGTDINKYQFGDVDPITGMNRERMFLPYTNDLSTKDKEGSKDYSAISTDLARVFGAFEQSLIEVEGVVNMDSFSQLIRDFELASKVFDVNIFGTPKKDATTKSLIELGKKADSENFKYLDKFIKLYVYGTKMQGFRDLAIPTPFKDKEGKTQYISGLSVIQSTAQLARFTFLGGINIAAPLRNFIMGRLSTVVQKSPYFASTSSLSNAADVMQRFKFSITNPKHRKMAASLAYFLPKTLNEGHFQDKVSVHAGFQILTPENMMKLLQKSEEWVKLPIHFALMENSTVRNGRIVNINQLVEAEAKAKHGYTNIYTLPALRQKEIQKEIAAEKKRLVKEDNLYNYMEVDKEGIMTIKGVDRNDPSVHHIRNITDDIHTKATGSAGDKNKNLIGTAFIPQMLSMFRSWIPRTVQARFGEFTPNNLTDAYEEGRMRSLWSSVISSHENNWKKMWRLLGGVVGIHDKETLAKIAHEVYEKKTGELQDVNKIERKGEIDEERFTRMYMDNIESAYRDLRATAALLLVVTSGLLAAGEGDDDDEKNLKRVMAKELRKYTQEFSFYYNPMSAYEIIKNPFPILSFHSNLFLIAEHTFKLVTDPEKAHPAKYVLKSLPISSFFIQYLPFFDPELAKEWNIRINPNAFNR